MSTPIDFGAPIDMHGNAINNRVVQVLAAAPSSPAVGQEYFDSTLGQYGICKNATGPVWAYMGTGGGSVTSVSVATANGFAGTVATATSTPAITLTTTVTGLLKGNGTAVSAAAAGTDYLAPNGNGSTLTNLNGSSVATGTVAAARLPSLDAITAPAAALSLNSQKITNLASGTTTGDAATYGQLLSLVNGTTWKPAVAVVARTNITLSGEQTIDGVTTSASRVAVTGQTTGSQNGIYTSAAGTWARAADLTTGASAAGAAFFVEQGTTNADTQWVCTNALGADTVGTNALTFQQFGAAASYTADESTLHLSGTTFSVKSTYAGQTSITTLGTIATGVWAGTAVAVANGGTGAATAGGARTNLGAVGVYSAAIGNGSATSFTVAQATHGLRASQALRVTVRTNDATGAEWVTYNSVNTSGDVVVQFTTAPTANQFLVIIMG